jgi:hypothetical protein
MLFTQVWLRFVKQKPLSSPIAGNICIERHEIASEGPVFFFSASISRLRNKPIIIARKGRGTFRRSIIAQIDLLAPI